MMDKLSLFVITTVLCCMVSATSTAVVLAEAFLQDRRRHHRHHYHHHHRHHHDTITINDNSSNSNSNNSLLRTVLRNRGGGVGVGGRRVSHNNNSINTNRGGGWGQQQQQGGSRLAAAGDDTTTVTGNGEASSSSSSSSFVPPIYKKSRKERSFIESILKYNFLFQDFGGTTTTTTTDDDEEEEEEAAPTKDHTMTLEHDLDLHHDTDLAEIVSSFEEVSFSKKSLLTKQGDVIDTDYLYIIYSGQCSVNIDGKQLEEPYGTMTRGALIGDLAMLYDTARRATVIAETEVKAYRMHKRTYFHFLNSADQKQQEQQSSSSSDTTTTTPVTTPKERLQKEVSEIDTVIDQISGVKQRYGGNIIQPFQPMRTWLWSRWKGTIMQYAWKTAVLNMVLAAVFQFGLRYLCNTVFHVPITWSVGEIPDKAHPIIAKLTGLNGLWNVGLTLTTFTLTFFLSQAYALWMDVYGKARDIQARLSDVSFLLASRAERDPKTKQYTARSHKALDDVAQCVRLFHALMWASYTRKFSKLLTPKGLSRLLSRGSMTRKQYECLIKDNSHSTARTTTLQWIYIRLTQGIQDGVFPQTTAFENCVSDKLLRLNDSMGGIGDSLDAKIPLAYGQFVQLLVDVFVILAPFALYSELGLWSIPAVGILTSFYAGMLDLSKILLFPLDNNEDDFYKDASVNMDCGVLIRESNIGSKLWKSGVEDIPF